ncbi:hypothetical protein, partial [Roseisolibacter sp. H3M3-2]|uniref:hypothetical protein n=1 Tax=Roseisolibacter sp. H3M3-2 TaxID=3031323 RepID=UPI0023DB12EF
PVDSIGGVTNNSAESSPKPIAQWVLRNRRVVGNTLTMEFVAFHRDGRAGKPVAAGRCWATDIAGTKTTAVVVATGPIVLAGAGDLNHVIGYRCSVDLSQWLDASAIADGTAVLGYASVYPHVGDAGSVLTASGTADARGFTPQTFLKHAARASDSPTAYVAASSCSDETVTAAGVGGTSTLQKIYGGGIADPGAGSANKFCSIKSAIEALKTATTRTGGVTDGTRVRVGAGTFALVATAALGTYQNTGELIIERDGVATRAEAIVTVSNVNLRNPYLTFRDITLQRSSNLPLSVTSGRLALTDVALDNGAQTTVIYSTSPLWVNGLTVTNLGAATNNQLYTGSQPIHLIRGLSIGTPSGAEVRLDCWSLIGSNVGNASCRHGSRDGSGTVIAFNQLRGRTGALGPMVSFLDMGTTTAVNGVALVQNLFEYTSATSNPSFRPSADAETYSIRHLVQWHNTFAGAGLWGRENWAYDETLNVYRANILWSPVGNIHVTVFSKHDWFVGTAGAAGSTGTNDPIEAAKHIGSWSSMYGVGARGEFHQYAVDSGDIINGDRSLAFYGLKAARSTSSVTRLDPLFTGPEAATTWDGTTATARAGNGVYTLQSGSSAKARVANCPLHVDLAGGPRAATCSSGAYE